MRGKSDRSSRPPSGGAATRPEPTWEDQQIGPVVAEWAYQSSNPKPFEGILVSLLRRFVLEFDSQNATYDPFGWGYSVVFERNEKPVFQVCLVQDRKTCFVRFLLPKGESLPINLRDDCGEFFDTWFRTHP